MYVGDDNGGTSGRAGIGVGVGWRQPVLKSRTTFGVIQAVLTVALELAQSSTVTGISEAATLVSVLVRLVADNASNPSAGDWRVRWCQSIIHLLERAELVLGKVRRVGRTPGDGGRRSPKGCPRVRSVVSDAVGAVHPRGTVPAEYIRDHIPRS